MGQKIRSIYSKKPSYKAVVDELGEQGIRVDARTVKKHIQEEAASHATIARNRDETLPTGKSKDDYQKSSDEELVSRAITFFKQNISLVDVSIATGMTPEKTSKLYAGYLELDGRGILNELYHTYGREKILQMKRSLDLGANVAWMTDMIDSLNDERSSLVENVDLLTDEIDTLTSRYVSLDKTRRQLKASNEKLREDKGDLEFEKKILEQEIERYKKSDYVVNTLRQLKDGLEEIMEETGFNTIINMLHDAIVAQLSKNPDYVETFLTYFKIPKGQRQLLRLTPPEELLKKIFDDLDLELYRRSAIRWSIERRRREMLASTKQTATPSLVSVPRSPAAIGNKKPPVPIPKLQVNPKFSTPAPKNTLRPGSPGPVTSIKY